MSPPALSYSIAPSSVDCSDAQGASVATLALTVTNATQESVPCTSIDVAFPVGLDGPRLTESPDLVGVSAGSGTPWALWGAGDGTFHARALPPATGVAPGEALTFVFTTVVIDDQPGTAAITVTDRQGSTTVSVSKAQPAPAQGTAPHIAFFTATPSQVALGAETTLTWSTENADSCSLVRESGGTRALPTTLTPPAGGSIALPMGANTICVLEAVGEGGRATSQVVVSVAAVAIDSFTVSPAGPVAPGTPVTLSWSTRFAVGCSVDQGIGPVEDSATRQVTPTQTTLYTLTADGLETAQSAVEVQVQ